MGEGGPFVRLRTASQPSIIVIRRTSVTWYCGIIPVAVATFVFENNRFLRGNAKRETFLFFFVIHERPLMFDDQLTNGKMPRLAITWILLSYKFHNPYRLMIVESSSNGKSFIWTQWIWGIEARRPKYGRKLRPYDPDSHYPVRSRDGTILIALNI